ncbi:hypothetical protein NPIL_212051 [Nephila pilipes]|uniref:Uncharacterized protein n=1 Tax=Nephila pilipes TaxID=299642 RepID=A0A8X6QVV6_NEPPI|nr:hypothetical protein NPIL_212051 [Nephila pilipes]
MNLFTNPDLAFIPVEYIMININDAQVYDCIRKQNANYITKCFAYVHQNLNQHRSFTVNRYEIPGDHSIKKASISNGGLLNAFERNSGMSNRISCCRATGTSNSNEIILLLVQQDNLEQL